MDRRRFLVIAAAASSAGLAPRTVLAATDHVAAVRVIRWPREVLIGAPGRCAGARGSVTLTLERLLSTR
ncbi:MAG: hypothetical protein JO225_15210 [Candidatus Eremiobacteraeota bacterium]|nr:hypothetical protein [Candidatus Eremiobacteraeota bacterium]